MNDAINKALSTWYPKDNPLHLDPLHPAIKLAGEAGELLDLYGKHKFKPGFDWMDCKHYVTDNRDGYVPLVLDELGDWWYYWRILCYQDSGIAWDTIDYHKPQKQKELKCLRMLSELSLYILNDFDDVGFINTDELGNAFRWFVDLLYTLDVTLDEITELNYLKLNSESTNHGWKDAGIKETR